jgi:phosphoribosyl 1,2-cyclic phosphodiesterase
MAVRASLVCHPGPTVGYRINENGKSAVYLPDHEPALGARRFPEDADWTSGFDLAQGADILIHDTQYTPGEYVDHIGWGHSSLPDAVAFAEKVAAKKMVTFHHDPQHDDAILARMVEDVRRATKLPFSVIGGTEGATFAL